MFGVFEPHVVCSRRLPAAGRILGKLDDRQFVDVQFSET